MTVTDWVDLESSLTGLAISSDAVKVEFILKSSKPGPTREGKIGCSSVSSDVAIAVTTSLTMSLVMICASLSRSPYVTEKNTISVAFSP